MYRVTVVTGDESLVETLEAPLRADGFETLTMDRPIEEAELDPAAAPDVLVLDVRQDGAAQPGPYRSAWPDTEIILIVSLHQIESLDPGLGVDDFVVVPLQPAELRARVHQTLWRHGRSTSRNTIAAGDLVLDLTNYHVFDAGRPITLTYKEYELLRFLMSHAGTVFNRETLLNRVWGYNYYGGSRTVDVHIRRLRSKLDGSRYSYIETVRNVGYRFAQPLR